MVGVPKKPLGKSVVNTTIVKHDHGVIKQELEGLKRELLIELAKILGEVRAAQLLGVPLQSTDTANDSMPMYIPSDINTGKDMEAEITVQEKQSSSGDVDEAAEALRKLKEKGKK